MQKNPFIALHTSVFLFGFTPILGKLISLNAYSLVWWRILLSSLIFLLFPHFFKQLKALSKKQLKIYIGIGFLVALHWITFYASIKVANSVSLTLACFGLTATFTSYIEPLITKKKFRMLDNLIGILAFGGISIIFMTSEQNSIPPAQFNLAFILGVLSSVIAAIFTSLNARYAKDSKPVPMTFVELTSGFVFLSVFFLFFPASFEPINSANDLILMLLFAFFCTNIAFALNLQALRSISAFTANIAINLEPIYGILWAVILFNENQMLNAEFYWGVAIILITVIIHPLVKDKKLIVESNH